MIRAAFERRSRASGPPIPLIAEQGYQYGPGAAYQPAHQTLLHENLGLADAATKAIANRIASLEFQVTRERRTTEGTTETEVIDDHPLKRLLDRPHPNLSRHQLLRLTAQWIVGTGEAYYVKVGSGFGVPVELHPLAPWLIEPVVQGGVIDRYQISDGSGRIYDRPAEQIVRIYFPDPENPWRSEGYIGPSAIALDAHKFAMEHLRKFYQHDATPKAVLEGDKDLSRPPPRESPEHKAFVEHWKQTYHGRHREGEGGVPRMLFPGWKMHELQGGAGEATKYYLEYWRDELLMTVGGVPRSVLGQVVSGDRSSAEVNQWVFDMYAILPLSILISDSLTLQLASDFDSEIRVGFAPFISVDKEFELKREAHDLEHAIRTPNKVLSDREDDPVPWGEEPLISSKLKKYDPSEPTPLQQATPGNQVPAEEPDQNDDEADRLARSLHAGVRQLHRAMKRRRVAA